jgi:sugar lactone lactonase YvrE
LATSLPFPPEAPDGIALSPDGTGIYVANTGLFEYTVIPGTSEKDPLGTDLRDVDDDGEIRKQIEKSVPTLSKPKNGD